MSAAETLAEQTQEHAAADDATDTEVKPPQDPEVLEGDDRGEDPDAQAVDEPPAYDYEAERAKKLAYRASLTEEDIARIRKHEKPADYAFGRKIVEGVEGTSASGDADERERSALEIERDQRIEQAARVDDWQARLDTMSHDERVAATLECLGRRPAFARVLRAVLEHCREERNSDEVEAYIEMLPDFAANRQSSRRYVFFLMRTGALSEVGYDAEGNPVDERSVGAVQAALDPSTTAEAVDSDADVAEDPQAVENDPSEPQLAEKPREDSAPEDPQGAEAATEPADDAALEGTPAQSEGFSDEAEPVATDPADAIVEWRVVTTAVGLEALEATDARGQLRTLLRDQAEHRYAAYLDVLTFCEEPRTLAEISEFLIGNPGLEIDDRGVVNMQPNAYIGKLDKAGALVWTGDGWQTTREALEVLDTL